MPKYPTPEEAVDNFTTEVSKSATQKKWGERAAAGAEKLGDWFDLALPEVYDTIASDEFQKQEDPWERSRMVGTKIQDLKKEYRKKKLEALVKAVRPAARR